MVLATFWCSYIAAYKLWKYVFRTNSTALANVIPQQSLRNNKLKEYVKTEQMDMNTITASTGDDIKIAVELAPTTAVACEMVVDVVTAPSCVPEFPILFESVTATEHDIIPFEVQTVNGIAHEFTLEVETVSAYVPEFPILFESVTATEHDIPFEVQTVNGIAHEFTLEVETVSAFVPEFSFELESVSAVTEIPLEEEIVTGIAHEFVAEVKTVNAFTHEFAAEIETVSEIVDDEVQVSCIAHECACSVEVDSSASESPLIILSPEAQPFVPQVDPSSLKRSLYGDVNDESVAMPNSEETGIDGGVEQPVTLNSQAKEFVPSQNSYIHKKLKSSFLGDPGAPTVTKNKETGTTVRIERSVALNVQAKEFVPSEETICEATAAVSNPVELGIAETERSLNVFAREFVPSNIQE